MLSRRRFLLSCGALAALSGCSAAPITVEPPSAPAEPSAAERLAGLLETFFQEELDASPEQVTGLGLDKGARVAAKSRLDARSVEALDEARARNASQARPPWTMMR